MRWHWKNFTDWISGRLKATPFVGHLFGCPFDSFWGAGVEYLHTLVWSTMPFWLGAALLYAQSKSGNTPMMDLLVSTFKNGELLVFAISTLTPITFFTLFENPNGRFPHRLGIGSLAIILIIGCAALFALQKGQVDIKPAFLYFGSIYLAGSAIILRYIAVVYNQTRVVIPTERDLNRSQQTYIDDFDSRANEQPG